MNERGEGIFPVEETFGLDDILADAAEAAAPVQSDLQRVVALCESLIERKAVVADLETQLEAAKKLVADVEQTQLPELMKEIKLTKLELEDGSTVELDQKLQCGITEARAPAAFQWLIDNDFAGLIKTEIRIAFDRGDFEQADEILRALKEDLEQEGAQLVPTVHNSTLKSWVKEQLEKGTEEGKEPFPRELFGVFVFDVAKVVPPKKSRK